MAVTRGCGASSPSSPALNLDVAAFQECKHWADDDSALLHLAEEQLGMTGFLAESRPPRVPPGRVRQRIGGAPGDRAAP